MVGWSSTPPRVGLAGSATRSRSLPSLTSRAFGAAAAFAPETARAPDRPTSAPIMSRRCIRCLLLLLASGSDGRPWEDDSLEAEIGPSMLDAAGIRQRRAVRTPWASRSGRYG